MIKASVIIPAYNAEKVIGNCLNALRSQTANPHEVIVVDDGSKDGTIEAARKFSGVRVITQKHRGPAAARNLGAKNASGDILLFTDADCVPEKAWIKSMLKPFADKMVSGAQGAYKTKQKSVVARFSQAEIEDRYSRMRRDKVIDFIGTYSAGYRRSLFMDFGGFDESFPEASGEDPELSFRMSDKGHRLVFVPDAIVYHTHPDTIRKYLRQKYWRAYWRVLLYKKHPGKAIKESYTPQTLKIQIMLLYIAAGLLVAGAFLPSTMLLSALCIIAVFALSLPVSASSFSGGFSVGVFAPFMIFLRSVAFALGLLSGTLSSFARPRPGQDT